MKDMKEYMENYNSLVRSIGSKLAGSWSFSNETKTYPIGLTKLMDEICIHKYDDSDGLYWYIVKYQSDGEFIKLKKMSNMFFLIEIDESVYEDEEYLNEELDKILSTRSNYVKDITRLYWDAMVYIRNDLKEKI